MSEKKTIIFLAIVILIIVSAIVIIYNMSKEENMNRADITEKNDIEEANYNEIDENLIGNYIVTTNSDEEKISPNAKIVFYKKYTGCNHTIKEKNVIESTLVNLNEDEIRRVYKDWDIISFSKDLVELYKEVPGQCEQHYIVKENDGKIAVYKITTEGENIKMKDTDISIEYLPEIDKEELKTGVKIDGDEELNLYLENFE